MFSRLGEWVDARTGYRALFKSLFNGRVHGGSRWGHTLGVVLLVLFGLEVVTGLGMAAFYAPTSTDAWASVYYIQTQLTLGWVMRGLHYHAGSAMVIVAGLHLLQTLLSGAYRAPRELNWVLGVILLQVLIIVSHLGYLLPGQLHSYWATEVLLGITANQPVIGESAQALIAGGPNAGNITYTHFYALHALLVPVLFAGMIWLHVQLRRRQGATAPISLTDDEAAMRTEPYFPYQLFKDLVVSLGVLAILLVVVVVTGGAPLEAPADPSVEYVARPEWYMLPVFQLRRYFSGPSEFIGTTVIPGVAVGFLVLLPFLHSLLSRFTAKAHQVLVVMVVAGLGATAALGLMVKVEDLSNPELARIMAAANEKGELARRLAQAGVPVTGPLDLHQNDPLVWGAKVFSENCASCHSDCSASPFEGVVCLDGYASRTWLTKFMQNPQSPHFYGNTDIDEMDAWEGTHQDLKAVVEFLYQQSDRPDVDPELARKGQELYVSEGCESCHSLDGKGTGDGPDLKGFASEAWLTDFIRQPDAYRFYGKLNEMDPFPHDKLSIGEVSAVIAYLRAQTDQDVKFP